VLSKCVNMSEENFKIFSLCALIFHPCKNRSFVVADHLPALSCAGNCGSGSFNLSLVKSMQQRHVIGNTIKLRETP
jgi:hypothetical protein